MGISNVERIWTCTIKSIFPSQSRKKHIFLLPEGCNNSAVIEVDFGAISEESFPKISSIEFQFGPGYFKNTSDNL